MGRPFAHKNPSKLNLWTPDAVPIPKSPIPKPKPNPDQSCKYRHERAPLHARLSDAKAPKKRPPAHLNLGQARYKDAHPPGFQPKKVNDPIQSKPASSPFVNTIIYIDLCA